MAQLRQDYAKFRDVNTEVLVVGPDTIEAFRAFWQKNNLPFIGLPDPKAKVLHLYGQEINLFKFGWMPAQVLVDLDGVVRYVHYGQSMSDIPVNHDLLQLIAELKKSEHGPAPE